MNYVKSVKRFFRFGKRNAGALCMGKELKNKKGKYEAQPSSEFTSKNRLGWQEWWLIGLGLGLLAVIVLGILVIAKA